MSTGIPCSDEVSVRFEEMKIRKACTFLVMQIVDNVVQVVEESQDTGVNGGVQPFVAYINEHMDECLYAVVDVEFTTGDDRPTSKLVFVSWIPDTTPVRAKMKYSGTKDVVLANLSGAAIKLNATDMSEIGDEGEEIIAKAAQYA